MKMTLKLTSMILALGATTASLGFISPAQAQAASEMRISTANLDLATGHGQRLLKLRIHRAADALCTDANERLEIGVRQAANICRADVTRSARAAITERAVAVAVHAKTGG